uniref:Uncharacterized protein n=1 Tax=Dendroctonus ponderosae TaxID=77166 RepID=A0AAR5PP73_DENPD
MILTQDRQRLSRAVGILIVLQGTTWFALALTGLIVLYSPPTSLTDTSMTAYTKYSQYLGRIIYNDFMIESQTRTISKVIRPTDFAAFLWIYVILSALWVVASLDQNFAIRYKKSRQSHITLVLGISTLLISLLDLVFFSLLARDFSTCPFSLGSDTTTNSIETTTQTTEAPSSITAITMTAASTSEASTAAAPLSNAIFSYIQVLPSVSSAGTLIDCQVANGIIMSLAARGYVLWAVNVVLGIVLIIIGAKASRPSGLLRYGKAIPRAKLTDQRKPPSPSDDLVFYDDNDRFSPPGAPAKGTRGVTGTPVALNNKNQNIYY